MPPADPQAVEAEGEEEKESHKSPDEIKREELEKRLQDKSSKHLPKKNGLKTTFQIGSEDDKKEIFSASFDYEDKYLAVAVSDGSICVYNMLNNKLASTIVYSNPFTGDTSRAM